MQTHYEVLGVAQDADAATLKAAYDGMSLGADPERLERLIEAYTVLSDPRRRIAYDEALATQRVGVGGGPSQFDEAAPARRELTPLGEPQVQPGREPLDPERTLLARPRSWPALLALAFLALVLISAFAARAQRDATGSIVASGKVQAADLRVGDCFNEPADQEFNDLKVVPCSDAHDGEVFHRTAHSAATGAAYPVEADEIDFISRHCLPAFETYVGRGLDQSELDVGWFSPTEEAWNNGDREYVCFLGAANRAALFESMRETSR